MANKVRADAWYSAREATALLSGEVTEATVKEYCRTAQVKCKRVGPRKRWMIQGSSIVDLRKKWGLD